MDRLAGDLGVDVIDELGCVPGDLLHADALRKTYGRCLRHNLESGFDLDVAAGGKTGMDT